METNGNANQHPVRYQGNVQSKNEPNRICLLLVHKDSSLRNREVGTYNEWSIQGDFLITFTSDGKKIAERISSQVERIVEMDDYNEQINK